MNDKISLLKERVLERYFEVVDDKTPDAEIFTEQAEVFEIEEVKRPIKNTVISHEVVIQGSLTVQGNLEVYGKINGDICVDGELRLDGASIVGRINAQNIIVKDSYVQGDLKINDYAQINEKSQIVGRIVGGDISLNCESKGDIKTNGILHLLPCAFLIGNINVKKLVVDEGARFEGHIKMKV